MHKDERIQKNNCECMVQKYLTPKIQSSMTTIKITQIFYTIYFKNTRLNV